ncbi:hypothetical protein DES41_1011207 [Pseudorhodoferax soli]|uniref:Parallel beta helix pectate lyase-like protein n=1 Tax=Pseudorhodoferax soli TaxID=545864 RepID=A0A368YA80_9BURK|nr:hypothetical protein DES41_1011207 [Pseudorhodoferax soli]
MRAPSRRKGKSKGLWLRWLAALVLCAGLVALAMGWWAYQRIGRTPGELMDYAERRLQGHTKLETVALPAMGLLRDWLDAPSPAERRRTVFVVPPVPELAAPPVAEPPVLEGKVWRVGPQEALLSIAAAAKLARSGDTVEVQAGTYRGDVAVWGQKQLTIRAVGGRVRLVADGRSAQGKAIWVIRNGDFDISGFDFVGAKVADKNGAGIRFEGGRLRVAHCLFWGNQNGILTIGNQPDSQLEVVSSEFGYNGDGDGQSHNIYVGRIGRFSITGSYLHHADTGHLLKSRAAVNEVFYNRLSDEDRGRASYEMDFPNGGVVHLVGNVVQQGRRTENSVMVSFGAEGLAHRRNTLQLANNTLVNDQPYGGTFVRAAPGTERVQLTNNLLVGPGGLQLPMEHTDFNTRKVDWSAFVQPARYDYRLNDSGMSLAYQGGQAEAAVPSAQYVHPLQVQRLNGPPVVVGALQPESLLTRP